MSKYQQEYKKLYHEKNKIITFPLTNIFYEELRKKSLSYDLSVNSYAKHIITNFLNKNDKPLLTLEEKEYIEQYIHISRGIANNLNQLTHKTHIGKVVDIDILISSLKHYEDEFKKFVTKKS
jgi:hypothetical protein